ncbi:MAG: glycosyltransferase family 2 protein [Dehalococcoidia bacterium]
MTAVHILIPTYCRPAALAVTLACLIAQSCSDFRVVISDQSENADSSTGGEVSAVLRVLKAHGRHVEVHRHLPRRGMAEQRQYRLDQASAPFALFVDDDVILEPFVVEQMFQVIRKEGCGFVGSALLGLGYDHVVRPEEEAIEFWHGPVEPELVVPETPQWERYRLHSANNLHHVQQRLGLTPENSQTYRVAWVGGCTIYDTEKLRAAGGFSFWKQLPVEHAGEDALAQLRVMERFGGCGLMPSGAYHQAWPTTIPDREVDAPQVLR